MKCEACDNELNGRSYRINCCKQLFLCRECSEIELIKETNDPDEMLAIIKISKKEAIKRIRRLSKNKRW